MNLTMFTGKKNQNKKTSKFFGSWFLVYHPSDLSSTTSLFTRQVAKGKDSSDPKILVVLI